MEKLVAFDFDKAGWRHLKEQDLQTRGKTIQTWVNNLGYLVQIEAGVPCYYLPGPPVEPIGNMQPPKDNVT